MLYFLNAKIASNDRLLWNSAQSLFIVYIMGTGMMFSASSNIRVEGTEISPWHPRLDAFKLMHGCKGVYQAGTSSGCVVKKDNFELVLLQGERWRYTLCTWVLTNPMIFIKFWLVMHNTRWQEFIKLYSPSKPSFSRPFSLNHGTVMNLGSR